MKYDNHFKRFNYRGKRLINAEFAAIVVAHNIRKMIAKAIVYAWDAYNGWRMSCSGYSGTRTAVKLSVNS